MMKNTNDMRAPATEPNSPADPRGDEKAVSVAEVRRQLIGAILADTDALLITSFIRGRIDALIAAVRAEQPTAREELERLKPHVEKWKTADGREVRSRLANDLLSLIDARLSALPAPPSQEIP